MTALSSRFGGQSFRNVMGAFKWILEWMRTTFLSLEINPDTKNALEF